MISTHGSVQDTSVARFAMYGTSTVAKDVRKPDFAAGGATGRISRHVICHVLPNFKHHSVNKSIYCVDQRQIEWKLSHFPGKMTHFPWKMTHFRPEK